MKKKIFTSIVLIIFIGNLLLTNTALATSEIIENIRNNADKIETIEEKESTIQNEDVKDVENNSKVENTQTSEGDINNGDNKDSEDIKVNDSNLINNNEEIKNNENIEEINDINTEKNNEVNLENDIEKKEKQVLKQQSLEDRNVEIPAQIIPNGIYRISMFKNAYNYLSFEIAGGSKYSGANVELGQWINRNNDKNKFKITYDIEDGYYTIQNVNSGNALDVQNGGMTLGTNVWQYTPNGTDAQKWKIKRNDDGSFSFISKKNGLAIDIQNGKMSIGSNIQLYGENGTDAQKFKLISLDKKEERTVENGIYKIALSINNNKTIGIENSVNYNEANVIVEDWTKWFNENKIFQLTYNEDDGYYTIKNINSEKVLEAQGGGILSGTNVCQYEGNYTDAQRWKIEKNADGTYGFVNKKSGLYLNVSNNNIEISAKTSNSSQKFNISTTEEKPERTIEDGIYRVSMFESKYNYLSLEISGASKNVGANVELGQWINKNNDKNKFKITYDIEDGYYTIQNINSGNVLDAQNGGITPGTNVWQHAPNGTDAQKWLIEKREDGSYKFTSKKSGLLLDVQNAEMNVGANIQLWYDNGYNAQKFELISLDKKPERIVEDNTYKITLSNETNKSISIENTLSDNGLNVTTGEWTSTLNANKKFKLIYNEDDGYYTIQSQSSGKVLEAEGGGITSGTNVWQYEGNYTDAQRWKIEKNADGTYSFVNKKSGLYLNVSNNNIEISAKTSNSSQKFQLTKVEVINPEEYIEEGTYKIVVGIRPDLSVDVKDESRKYEANIQLGSASDTIRNEFNIIADGNGYYTISSINSGNVLDVQNGGIQPGTNVWQHISNGTDAQKWTIRKNSNGTYSIISKKNGLLIDVKNAEMAIGINIQLWNENGQDAQKFQFIKQDNKTERYIEDSKYKITSCLNSSIGFDIEGATVNDGAVLQIWQYLNVEQQQFEIKYVNGYYFIINIKSNKALQNYEDNIRQYTTDYNKDEQKWILKPINNGYAFISKTTGQCITIPNSNIENGTDLQMNNYTGNNNQLFNFETPRVLKVETGYYGSSGLKIKGDSRGSLLKYYKIGNGPNVFFGTFAVHGFEDLWAYDGQELTKIAENFKNRLIEMQDFNLADKWTIYLLPSVNPDGEYYGWTNNGPGRTSLYSLAPNNKGIDINRCWSTGYTKASSDRNYNGTSAFQSYEARALRDFLLSKRSTQGQTILIDLHGWLNETIGDEWLGSFYRQQYGITKHIYTYGQGYLVNWARTNLGYNGVTARSALVELPEVSNSYQVSSYGFSDKYINATLNVLRSY